MPWQNDCTAVTVGAAGVGLIVTTIGTGALTQLPIVCVTVYVNVPVVAVEGVGAVAEPAPPDGKKYVSVPPVAAVALMGTTPAVCPWQ